MEFDRDTGLPYTHAYRGLDAFEEWLENNQDDLPNFDQATLLTGYETCVFRTFNYNNVTDADTTDRCRQLNVKNNVKPGQHKK